jgi:hypothetical protein
MNAIERALDVARRTAGREAYEADCARQPREYDGALRRKWESLPSWARASWETTPQQ